MKAVLFFLFVAVPASFARASDPNWFRPPQSGGDGSYSERAAAIELDARIARIGIPADPDEWTSTDRVAAFRRRYDEIDALNAMLRNLPRTGGAFVARVQALNAEGRLSLDNLRAAYRRERLDLSEDEAHAFDGLLRAWTREVAADRVWGPGFADPEKLREAFVSGSPGSLAKFAKDADERGLKIAKFLFELSMTHRPEIARLPLALMGTGGFGESLWPEDAPQAGSLEWSRSGPLPADPPRGPVNPWPSGNPPRPADPRAARAKSGSASLTSPWEAKLVELADAVAGFAAAPVCDGRFNAPDGAEIAFRRMADQFHLGRVPVEAKLARAQGFLTELRTLAPTLERWKASPQEVRSLARELSRDQFSRVSVRDWVRLIDRELSRLSPGMRANALGVRRLVDLAGRMRSASTSLDGNIDGRLEFALSSAAAGDPSLDLRLLEEEAAGIRARLEFDVRRLARAKPTALSGSRALLPVIVYFWERSIFSPDSASLPGAREAGLAGWNELTPAGVENQLAALKRALVDEARSRTNSAPRCGGFDPGPRGEAGFAHGTSISY